MSSNIPAAIKTDFTEMFDIQYPLIAAPMFLVSNEEMVVAASEAGGIGTFPALNYRPIENFRSTLQKMRRRTSRPIGVNIIVQKANPVWKSQLEVALEEEVDLIITSLGNPKAVIEAAQGTKTKVFCDVVGLTHAKKVADYGADGLIAVGSGAGGHAGDISPFALIPYLKSQIDLPVIAAGSIVDGKGVLAALALGASGAYMGTRVIASKEAQVIPEYKESIVNAGPEDIVNTDRVDGFPGNFIRTPSLEKVGLENNLVEEVFNRSKKLKRWISLARAGRALWSSQKGTASYKTVFSAGHGVGLIDSVEPIKDIFYNTVSEYHQLKQQLP